MKRADREDLMACFPGSIMLRTHGDTFPVFEKLIGYFYAFLARFKNVLVDSFIIQRL